METYIDCYFLSMLTIFHCLLACTVAVEELTVNLFSFNFCIFLDKVYEQEEIKTLVSHYDMQFTFNCDNFAMNQFLCICELFDILSFGEGLIILIDLALCHHVHSISYQLTILMLSLTWE